MVAKERQSSAPLQLAIYVPGKNGLNAVTRTTIPSPRAAFRQRHVRGASHSDVAAGETMVDVEVAAPESLDDLLRETRRGRTLVPPQTLDVVADELFVQRRLRSAGPISRRGPEPRG